jgi:NitT/TauT family transport system substrate-binding protein
VFTRAGSVAGGVTPVAGLDGADVLDDGVFARGGWLARPDNRDVAVRFLQASFVGWAYCRERPGACVRILRERRPALDAARQRRRLDAVNALVWPNETGIGTMDPAAFRRTAQVAFERGAVERPAAATAWRDDLALLAVTQGEDEEATDGSGAHVDLRGTYWQPRG